MNIKELRRFYRQVRLRQDIEACKELGEKLKMARVIKAQIAKARELEYK